MEKNIRNTKTINKDEGKIWRSPLGLLVVGAFVLAGLRVVAGFVLAGLRVVAGFVLAGLSVGAGFVLAGAAVDGAFVLAGAAVTGAFVLAGAAVTGAFVGSSLEHNVIIPSRQTVKTIDLFHILIAVFVFPMLDEFSSRWFHYLSQISIELLSHLIGYS